MQVKGIIWVGTATSARREMSAFFQAHLGMNVATEVPGFTRLQMPSGDRVEIFGPESQEYGHLDTGPIAGFWIDDAAAARAELIQAGVDSCTPLEAGRDGHRWFYFKAPDGNYYELCERDRPDREG